MSEQPEALRLADELSCYGSSMPDVHEAAAELRRLHQHELAHIKWLEKTEWVQDTAHYSELGEHRADVIKQRFDRLHKVNQELLEALKLALEGLEKWHFDKDPRGAADYIAAIHDALAEQPAQGCDYCNHPQYAGIKCKNCGREQPAQPSKPLTDEQIDRAIAELGLNYLADAANNRAVLRELCRKASCGIKE